jgi:protein-tyrosine-phosphatase
MEHEILSAYPPEFFKLISHQIRWEILRELSNSDLKVLELVEHLEQPQNLVSYHLQLLSEHGLVSESRSLADGREIYYRLNLDHVKNLYRSSGLALHPALLSDDEILAEDYESAKIEPMRVLFLCTHNSARSQMAEGILRIRGGERVQAFSAGTEPSKVHPLAVRAMEAMQIDISKHVSKSLEDFHGQDFDYIITVCDRARESCPIFPGDPHQIHWSFPDPAAVEGTEDERYDAFQKTSIQLNTRIGYLLMVMGKKS